MISSIDFLCHVSIFELIINSDEPESFTGIDQFEPELQDEILKRIELKSLKLRVKEFEKLSNKYPELKQILKDTSPASLASKYSNLGAVNLLLEKDIQ